MRQVKPSTAGPAILPTHNARVRRTFDAVLAARALDVRVAHLGCDRGDRGDRGFLGEGAAADQQ